MKKNKRKVYAYYLKSDSSLYAYTEFKALADEFELERDMRIYKKKIFKMSEPEYQVFNYKHNSEMLFSNVLNDSKKDFSFATTYFENEKLDNISHQMDNKINELYEKVRKFPLKKEYEDLFTDIFSIYGDGVNTPILNFNTFPLLKTASAISFFFFPNKAAPIGDSLDILFSARSTSVGPTIVYSTSSSNSIS